MFSVVFKTVLASGAATAEYEIGRLLGFGLKVL
jgi:hypothetical protein